MEERRELGPISTLQLTILFFYIHRSGPRLCVVGRKRIRNPVFCHYTLQNPTKSVLREDTKGKRSVLWMERFSLYPHIARGESRRKRRDETEKFKRKGEKEGTE